MALIRNKNFELIPPSLDFSNDIPLRTRYQSIRNALPVEERAEFGVRILEYIRLEHLSNFQFNAKKCSKDDWVPFFAFWKANGPPTAAGHAPNWTTSHVMVTRLSHLRKDYIFRCENIDFFDLLWNYIGRLGLDYLQNHQHGPGLSAARATSETNEIVAYWQRNCGKPLRNAASAALRVAQGTPAHAQSAPTQNAITTAPNIPAPIPPPITQRAPKRKNISALNLQPDARPPRRRIKLIVRSRDNLLSEANTQDHTVEDSSSAVRTKFSSSDASSSAIEAPPSSDESLSEIDAASSNKKATSSNKKATSSGKKASSFKGKEPSNVDNVPAYGNEAPYFHREVLSPCKRLSHSDSEVVPSVESPSCPSSFSSDNGTPIPAPPPPPPTDAAPLPWDIAGLLVFNALNFAHHFASTAAKSLASGNELIDNLMRYFSLPAEELAQQRTKVLQELEKWKAYHKVETEKIEKDEAFMFGTVVGKLKDADASNAAVVSVEELQDAIARGLLKQNVEGIDEDHLQSGGQISGEQESGQE